MPHAFGDRVRHVTSENCAVAVPEREPARNHRLAPSGCSRRWARLNLNCRKSQGREYSSTEPFFKRRTTSVFRPLVVGSRWRHRPACQDCAFTQPSDRSPPWPNLLTPLRQRMIDDMRMRNLSPLTQAFYVRSVKNFAAFHRKPPFPNPVRQTGCSQDNLPGHYEGLKWGIRTRSRDRDRTAGVGSLKRDLRLGSGQWPRRAVSCPSLR
jgi:hypothetical protein